MALIGIIVGDQQSAGSINDILHEYAPYVIGRMGVPYHKRQVSVISIVLDAPPDAISALAGKLGMLGGVSTKTVYAKLPEK